MSEDLLKNKEKQALGQDLSLNAVLCSETPIEGLEEGLDSTRESDLIQSLREIEQNPSNAQDPQSANKHSGFTLPNKIAVTYPLHVAAQQGDIITVQKLLAQGWDVNQEDFRSAMPLHVATMFGHTDIVKLLIKQGADLFDKSYQNQTALHLATEFYRADIVKVLLDSGADAHTIDASSHTTLDDAVIEIQRLTNELGKYPANVDLANKADAIIDIIQHLCAHMQGNPTVSMKIDGFIQREPVSVILDTASSYIPDATTRSKISSLVESLRAEDSSHDHYLEAKTFLNVFATSQVYPIHLTKSKVVHVNTDGFTAKYITQSITEGLESFSDFLQTHTQDMLTQKVATRLNNSFELATQYAHSFADKETSKLALQHYHNNETVLLPTGWHGHCVATFFSKEHTIFVVANAGPHYVHDVNGVHIYKMQDQDSLTADKINGILSNQSQLCLELHKLYDLGVIEKVGEIETPKQTHGNCTYYSFKIIIEAMALVEYMNLGVEFENAQTKAKLFSENFELHQNFELIDNILQTDCPVQLDAFKDIYQDLHQQGENSEIAKRTANYLQQKVKDFVDIDIAPQVDTPNQDAEQTGGWFDWGKSNSPEPGTKSDSDNYRLMDFESTRTQAKETVDILSTHTSTTVEADPFVQPLHVTDDSMPEVTVHPDIF
tara:strand:- start:48 stop:2036 length:1989 start_codon:yes stop_codon:yes gene_type:complete